MVAINDKTEMKPGVAERKWEIDSLCYPMRLSARLLDARRATRRRSTTHGRGRWLAVERFRVQQRKDGPGLIISSASTLADRDVMFERLWFADEKDRADPFDVPPVGRRVPLSLPDPVEPVRGVGARMLATVLREARGDARRRQDAEALAAEVEAGARKRMADDDGKGGEVWAYEIDGYGNCDLHGRRQCAEPVGAAADRLSADANDPLYRRTAALAWSPRNPYFFKGTAAEGIGGPHVGLDMIWPMSIITRADERRRRCDDPASACAG
jgi:meiotically up-regulated gene 157 (Mug157) protein